MRKILLLLIISIPLGLHAQRECAYELEEAQEMYNAGLIESIPSKLEDCLRTGFTKEEQLQAYKLVILAYLFNDDYERADSVMFEFLRDYPSYEPVATDPKEFIAMMETYDTEPIMAIGGRFSGSLSLPMITEHIGIHNNRTYAGNYVPGGFGFTGAVRIEKQLWENFLFTGEFEYSNLKYSYYLNEEVADGVVNMEISDFSSVEIHENQNYLRLPLGAAYSFMEGDFRPYVRMMLTPSLMLNASVDGQRYYYNNERVNLKTREVANVDVSSIRRPFQMWLGAGLGFQYDVGPGSFFFEALFHSNLMNQIPKGADLYLDGLADELFFVNDYFYLNQVTFSLGYMFPIYHPKKKGE